MKQKRDNNSTAEAKEKVLDYYFSDFRLFTIQDDLRRHEDMKITLRTMITMRIIAVKLPMMIPMTRDMVADMPDESFTYLVSFM